MKLTLPHWLALVLAFVLVAITWVMNEQANGQLVLPAVAVSVLTVLKTVLQMFSETPQNLARQQAASKLGPIAVLLVAGGLAGAAVTQSGCAQLQALVPELTQAENIIIADIQKGDTDGQVVADVAVVMGLPADAAAVLEAVTNMVTDLLETGLLAKHYPECVPNAKGLLVGLQARLAAQKNPPAAAH